MNEATSQHLARNIRQLRHLRNLTQDQLARLSGIPRPTLAHLESGHSNPTISILVKVASVLHISVEELISPPRSTTRFYPAASLPTKKRGQVNVRQLLPDVLGALDLERMELLPGARMVGTPHKTGTREYLACEAGKIQLTVSGEQWVLSAGDVVVFRGDQRHSYHNPTGQVAIGYSVILVGSA